MSIIRTLPAALQDLFGEKAKSFGRTTGFIIRERAFGADDFLTVLTFGYLHDSQATFATLASELNVTESALAQRFDQPETLAFMKAVLKAALNIAIVNKPKRLRALRSFHGVFLTDSTTIPLPPSLASLFPGCGGGKAGQKKTAKLKILVTYEAQSGTIHSLGLYAGKIHDSRLCEKLMLPEGSLHLADLAFFKQQRMQQATNDGRYWISRISCGHKLRLANEPPAAVTALHTFLDRHAVNDEVDAQVVVGRANHPHPLTARLVAWRCSPAETQRRQQRLLERSRRDTKKVSAVALAMCCWMVFVTNVPAPQLRPKQIGELYRLRWQIELLFKRWKSHLGLAKTIQKKKKNSCRVEVYSRILGRIVAEWFGAACGGPLSLPLVQVIKTLQKWCDRLCEALRQAAALTELSERIFRNLDRFRPPPRDRSRRIKTRNRLNFTVNFA